MSLTNPFAFLFLSSTGAAFLVVERYPKIYCSPTFLCLPEFLQNKPHDLETQPFVSENHVNFQIVYTHVPLSKELAILCAASWNLPHSCLFWGHFCVHSIGFNVSVVALVCLTPGSPAALLKHKCFKKQHSTLYCSFHSGQYLVNFFQK